VAADRGGHVENGMGKFMRGGGTDDLRLVGKQALVDTDQHRAGQIGIGFASA
jgi:hypothetical protein